MWFEEYSLDIFAHMLEMMMFFQAVLTATLIVSSPHLVEEVSTCVAGAYRCWRPLSVVGRILGVLRPIVGGMGGDDEILGKCWSCLWCC